MSFKFNLDRKKFIEWVNQDNPDLLAPINNVMYDLIKGSEYILTAQELLDQYDEIPSHIIETNTKVEFVAAEECVLIYKHE